MNERITTAGIVIAGDKVLVAKRSTGKDINGLWEFPGGKNRYGESEEDTLKREFEEELGISVEVGSFITSYDFIHDDILYHLKAYIVYPKSNDYSLSVHSETAFVKKEVLMTLDMVPSDAAIRDKIAEEYL